jgi:hypothetical protein
MSDWADTEAYVIIGLARLDLIREVARIIRKTKADGLREAADYLSAMEEMPRTFRDPVHAIIAQADKIERGCA